MGLVTFHSFDELAQVQLTAQEAWEQAKRHLTNAGRIKLLFIAMPDSIDSVLMACAEL